MTDIVERLRWQHDGGKSWRERADEAITEIERLRRDNKRLSTFRSKHGEPPPPQKIDE